MNPASPRQAPSRTAKPDRAEMIVTSARRCHIAGPASGTYC